MPHKENNKNNGPFLEFHSWSYIAVCNVFPGTSTKQMSATNVGDSTVTIVIISNK